MAFNGTGTFVRIMNWVQDKTNGINITASRMDTDSNDFVGGFNNCLTRDNQGKPAASFLPGTDAAYDLGSSGAHWRDLWASRNASIGGTLTVAGAVTLTSGLPGVALGANDSSGRGIAICRFKAANTSRNNAFGTTPGNDPDLAYAIAAAGTYDIEAFVSLTGAVSNAGISANVNYSGTMNANSSYGSNTSFSSTAQLNAAVAIASAPGTASITVASIGSSLIGNYIWIKGVLIATGAGTLAFSWSQNSSSANATQVNIGSFLKITQVS